MRDQRNDARHGLDFRAFNSHHPAEADRRTDDDGVELSLLVEVGGIVRPARDLGATVYPRQRLADDNVHATSSAISSARTIVLGKSSTLKALWCSGRTPSMASCAASSNAVLSGFLPASAASHARSRHGRVPTPPAASRA